MKVLEKRQEVKRGDVWMVNLPYQTGSVQCGARPCVVFSNEMANKYSPIIHIIPLTSKTKKELPVHVRIKNDLKMGLPQDSIALTEQSNVVDKTVLVKKIGECDPSVMRSLGKAMMLQFGLARITINTAGKKELRLCM